MPASDKHIIDTCLQLIEPLSTVAKQQLMERLSNSIRQTLSTEEKNEIFWSAFGSWEDDRSAEEIVDEIRKSRHFREKDLDF